MMNSTSTERSCDGCGKPCLHFHRRYKEKRYCQSCYQLLFRKRACPSCGRTVRLYVEEPRALCSDCEKKKPCVRCGRVGYRLGKFTRYGPVCSVCVRWFGEMKTCSRCGKPSRFPGGVTRAGIDEPVCPACARENHARCQMCTRWRLLKKMRKVCWYADAANCSVISDVKSARSGCLQVMGGNAHSVTGRVFLKSARWLTKPFLPE